MTTDGFESELARRLPLATAVLGAFGFAFEDAALEALYEANRGRCYTGVLEFPRFIAMLRDCLLEHGGSGHRMCAEARRGGQAAQAHAWLFGAAQAHAWLFGQAAGGQGAGGDAAAERAGGGDERLAGRGGQ